MVVVDVATCLARDGVPADSSTVEPIVGRLEPPSAFARKILPAFVLDWVRGDRRVEDGCSSIEVGSAGILASESPSTCLVGRSLDSVVGCPTTLFDHLLLGVRVIPGQNVRGSALFVSLGYLLRLPHVDLLLVVADGEVVVNLLFALVVSLSAEHEVVPDS